MQSKIRLPDELTLPALGAYADKELYLGPGLQPRRSADRGQGTSEVRTHQTQSEPDAWWRSIPPAMSWLMGLLIEGFAACGEAMHPGFFEHPGPDLFDNRELAEAPRCRHPLRHQSHTGTSYSGFGGAAYETGASDPLTQVHPDRPVRSAAANSGDTTRWEPPSTTSRHWSAPVTSSLANSGERAVNGGQG